MHRRSVTGVAVLVVAALTWTASCSGQQQRPVVGPPPQDVEDQFVPEPPGVRVEPWVQGLAVPWGLVFLPDGRALVTERAGRIRLIEDGELRDEPYAVIDVAAVGEGGLMGIAIHPQFPDPPYVYVMHTHRADGRLSNRVIRLRHQGDRAEMDRAIVEGIPGHHVHNGGRIAFGPDGMLYITTGDIWQAHLAQDRQSLGGKILRVAPDGAIPPDNPFPESPVWSLGHRNPQGLAWHPDTGDLFSSEHGPSGEFGLRGKDIINVIERGANYGWPRAVGRAQVEGLRDPLIMWQQATPPGGMTFHNGDLFVATLRSEALVRIQLAGEDGQYRVTAIERWFAEGPNRGVHGRLRDVVAGPDGALYVLTSNRDGRGRVRAGDDQILRILRE